MKNRFFLAAGVVLGLVCVASNRSTSIARAEDSSLARQAERTPIDAFIALAGEDDAKRLNAISLIREGWHDGDAAMLIEVALFARNQTSRDAMIALLAQATGQPIGTDLRAWYDWVWNREDQPHPNYASFKKEIYLRVDPRFAEYFDTSRATTIRLDEIRWGGVLRDGIPPLNKPETIPGYEAVYLADTDIVFGVEFGGQPRAYPKRILAWHEMVKDVVGGRSINGVYCTLCGSMIVYDTEVAGKHYELGTSGFLYRSNKLMYDHETKSMWSTLAGSPVVGPLVGKGLALTPLHVVTTTWGEWRRRHPGTDVLSLRTGYQRDYGEGVAYAAYFATDELMFTVPKLDKRLKNKDEVLIIRGLDGPPIAISLDFLRQHRIYHDSIGSDSFVVLTDDSGANRVYESGSVRFDGWESDVIISENSGLHLEENASRWLVNEEALVSIRDDAKYVKNLRRVSAHRAFWFGWHAAYPNTKLIK